MYIFAGVMGSIGVEFDWDNPVISFLGVDVIVNSNSGMAVFWKETQNDIQLNYNHLW